MVIRFFKSTRFECIIAISLIALLFWIPAFSRTQIFGALPEFHATAVADFIRHIPALILTLTAVTLVSLEAIYLNYIVNKHTVLYKKTFLPALIYVMMMSTHKEFLLFHPLLIVNGALLVILDNTFSLYKNDSPLSGMFNIGVFSGMLTLFYPPSASFFPFLLISHLLLRPFSWREWIVAMTGLSLAFFYYLFYLFMTDSLNKWSNYAASFYFHQVFSSLSLSASLLVTFSYLLLLFTLSIYTLQSHFYKNVIKTRIYQQVLVLFMVAGVASLFLSEKLTPPQFTIFAIPFSIFIAYYFIAIKKKWISEILFYLLAGLAIYSIAG